METIFNSPLPRPWSIGCTDDGRIFFINEETRVTSWLHPKLQQPIQTGFFQDEYARGACEKDFTADQREYYIDHLNLTTSWNLPSEKPLVPEPDVRRDIKRAASPSPLRRSNSARRKSLKQKSPAVKRNPNSQVVIRDWLYRQEGGPGPLKSWKKRWGVLADLCLFIYKGPEEGSILVSILLPSYQITPCPKDGQKHVLKIEHENMKSTYFACDNIHSYMKWLELINQAASGVEPKKENDEKNILQYNNYNPNLNSIGTQNLQNKTHREFPIPEIRQNNYNNYAAEKNMQSQEFNKNQAKVFITNSKDPKLVAWSEDLDSSRVIERYELDEASFVNFNNDPFNKQKLSNTLSNEGNNTADLNVLNNNTENMAINDNMINNDQHITMDAVDSNVMKEHVGSENTNDLSDSKKNLAKTAVIYPGINFNKGLSYGHASDSFERVKEWTESQKQFYNVNPENVIENEYYDRNQEESGYTSEKNSNKIDNVDVRTIMLTQNETVQREFEEEKGYIQDQIDKNSNSTENLEKSIGNLQSDFDMNNDLIKKAHGLYHTNKTEEIIDLLMKLRKSQNDLHEHSYKLYSISLKQLYNQEEIEKTRIVIENQISESSAVINRLECTLNPKEKTPSLNSDNKNEIINRDPIKPYNTDSVFVSENLPENYYRDEKASKFSTRGGESEYNAQDNAALNPSLYTGEDQLENSRNNSRNHSHQVYNGQALDTEILRNKKVLVQKNNNSQEVGKLTEFSNNQVANHNFPSNQQNIRDNQHHNIFKSDSYFETDLDLMKSVNIGKVDNEFNFKNVETNAHQEVRKERQHFYQQPVPAKRAIPKAGHQPFNQISPQQFNQKIFGKTENNYAHHHLGRNIYNDLHSDGFSRDYPQTTQQTNDISLNKHNMLRYNPNNDRNHTRSNQYNRNNYNNLQSNSIDTYNTSNYKFNNAFHHYNPDNSSLGTYSNYKHDGFINQNTKQNPYYKSVDQLKEKTFEDKCSQASPPLDTEDVFRSSDWSPMRASRSFQDLTEKFEKEEKQESVGTRDGVIKGGFRDRNHIRRLSGIFTPRPFYKSNSNLNELDDNKVGVSNDNKGGDSRSDNKSDGKAYFQIGDNRGYNETHNYGKENLYDFQKNNGEINKVEGSIEKWMKKRNEHFAKNAHKNYSNQNNQQNLFNKINNSIENTNRYNYTQPNSYEKPQKTTNYQNNLPSKYTEKNYRNYYDNNIGLDTFQSVTLNERTKGNGVSYNGLVSPSFTNDTFDILTAIQTPSKIHIPQRIRPDINENLREDQDQLRKLKAAQLARMIEKQRGINDMAGVGLGGDIARQASFKARMYD